MYLGHTIRYGELRLPVYVWILAPVLRSMSSSLLRQRPYRNSSVHGGQIRLDCYTQDLGQSCCTSELTSVWVAEEVKVPEWVMPGELLDAGSNRDLLHCSGFFTVSPNTSILTWSSYFSSVFLSFVLHSNSHTGLPRRCTNEQRSTCWEGTWSLIPQSGRIARIRWTSRALQLAWPLTLAHVLRL